MEVEKSFSALKTVCFYRLKKSNCKLGLFDNPAVEYRFVFALLAAVISQPDDVILMILSLLQEAELLGVCAVLLTAGWLVLALLLFEQLHLVPVGVQLAAQRVVLLPQGFGLGNTCGFKRRTQSTLSSTAVEGGDFRQQRERRAGKQFPW
ncbi:hypothetical protein EYF80_016686 [Liparis tanakae]|uniref:Uncharacterized protein n=1 Tax=Liparis tanakae TaxID=230148 RepID=A0A4Z2I4M2_9TELE|nr:hypothetical protein EYF80_016686 [Liparis tanakae]